MADSETFPKAEVPVFWCAPRVHIISNLRNFEAGGCCALLNNTKKYYNGNKDNFPLAFHLSLLDITTF